MTLLANAKFGETCDRVHGADTITAPLVDDGAGVLLPQSSGTQAGGDLSKVEVSSTFHFHASYLLPPTHLLPPTSYLP